MSIVRSGGGPGPWLAGPVVNGYGYGYGYGNAGAAGSLGGGDHHGFGCWAGTGGMGERGERGGTGSWRYDGSLSPLEHGYGDGDGRGSGP